MIFLYTLSAILIIIHGVSIEGSASRSMPASLIGPRKSLERLCQESVAEQMMDHPDGAVAQLLPDLPPDISAPVAAIVLNMRLSEKHGWILDKKLRRSQSVMALAFSPGGKKLATIDDGQAYVWDITTGGLLHSWPVEAGERSGGKTAILFDPTGQTVTAYWPRDARLHIFDLRTEQRERLNLLWPIIDMQYSHSGNTLLCVNERGNVYQLGATTGDIITEFTGYAEAINRANFSPDGTQAILAGKYGSIFINDTGTGRVRKTLLGHDKNTLFAGFTATGNRIVSLGGDECIRIWRADTGAEIRSISNTYSSIIDLSQTGSVGFAGKRNVGWAITPIIFSLKTGKFQAHISSPIMALPGVYQIIRELSFSPDGTQLALARFDGTTELWSDYSRELSKLIPAELLWFYKHLSAPIDPKDAMYALAKEKSILLQDKRFKDMFPIAESGATNSSATSSR